MLKNTLLVGLGLLGFCFPLAAQQTSRPERTKDETATLRQLRPSALDAPARLTLARPEFFSPIHDSVLADELMMLALSVGQRLPASSELDSMEMPPLDYFQDDAVSAAEGQKAQAGRLDAKDSPSEVITSPLSPLYYSGELGFFYGRSSGKFEREIMETYFLGTVGNEKFQITVGGAYGESNVDVPRFHSGSSKH
jgi:hypothetical protein